MNKEIGKNELRGISRQEIMGSKLEHVSLICQPKVPPMSWETFVVGAPPFAIALDGFVNSPPRYDEEGPRLNLDHHVGVDRLATRSTSGQVSMYVRQGLFEKFQENDSPKATVYVNDCDEDVCLSWFLLKYGKLTEQTFNPRLNRLISLTDALDTTAGAYPLHADTPFLEEMAWMYEPYRTFRQNGGVDQKDATAFTQVIEHVEERIVDYLAGEGQRIPLDTRYEYLGGGEDWSMVTEIGPQARTGMLSDGIKAFVSVRPRPDGNWTYVLGRMSVFVPFAIPELYDALNHAEQNETDKWGGSNTIGGSPRVAGSLLPPTIVEQIVRTLVG